MVGALVKVRAGPHGVNGRRGTYGVSVPVGSAAGGFALVPITRGDSGDGAAVVRVPLGNGTVHGMRVYKKGIKADN